MELDGISDIEGKAAMVAVSELEGERVSIAAQLWMKHNREEKSFMEPKDWEL